MRGSSLKIVATTSQLQQADTQTLEGEFVMKLRTFTEAAVDLAVFCFRVLMTALIDIQQRQRQCKVTTNGKAYLTVQECARLYNFSQRTVRDWAMQKKIPHYKFNDEIRFDPAEIETWAKRDITK